jgi:hypothetical protein
VEHRVTERRHFVTAHLSRDASEQVFLFLDRILIPTREIHVFSGFRHLSFEKPAGARQIAVPRSRGAFGMAVLARRVNQRHIGQGGLRTLPLHRSEGMNKMRSENANRPCQKSLGDHTSQNFSPAGKIPRE